MVGALLAIVALVLSSPLQLHLLGAGDAWNDVPTGDSRPRAPWSVRGPALACLAFAPLLCVPLAFATYSEPDFRRLAGVGVPQLAVAVLTWTCAGLMMKRSAIAPHAAIATAAALVVVAVLRLHDAWALFATLSHPSPRPVDMGAMGATVDAGLSVLEASFGVSCIFVAAIVGASAATRRVTSQAASHR